MVYSSQKITGPDKTLPRPENHEKRLSLLWYFGVIGINPKNGYHSCNSLISCLLWNDIIAIGLISISYLHYGKALMIVVMVIAKNLVIVQDLIGITILVASQPLPIAIIIIAQD